MSVQKPFENVDDRMQKCRPLVERGKPEKAVRLLLTVSPVPLTATASGLHVLQASVASKAVLRAAAAEFVADEPAADYFPSFEIITNPAARGRFFAANLRSVTPEGVACVMRTFLAAHGLAAAAAPEPAPPQVPADEAETVQCEEALLDAFGR